jgi:hypothetical protein
VVQGGEEEGEKWRLLLKQCMRRVWEARYAGEGKDEGSWVERYISRFD